MERSSLCGQNFEALKISYSEIGGHVLTPFLGISQDGREELIGNQEIEKGADSR